MTSQPAAPRPHAGDDLVVLLDESGSPVGTADRLAVHTESTPRHLAFSCHILDRDGQVLLTRRALAKGTWPGVWTNSCCGHPRPGEEVRDAVVRRVEEELGLVVEPERVQTVLPEFSYAATDASGVVENELCPVHVVWLAEPAERVELHPDPAEVDSWLWTPWDQARALARTAVPPMSPWSVLQFEELGALRPA
ncbi:isopentenyl-diphosphate Delta-isomerase [Acidipropionibacterium timonense]|uniref:isopentenyl-diphosphate Delta-isomerase n=1 Tax=Acidipropionibacterium timonense TaxID=2161818 RepID=UPI00103208BE|nr:isopentenyl-diphosphate Delta-isomerase [Acidipropionibacterium timonense]